MGTQFDYTIHRLADLKNQTVELERRLSDARASFDRELAEFAGGQDGGAGNTHDPQYYLPPYDEVPYDEVPYDEVPYDEVPYDGGPYDGQNEEGVPPGQRPAPEDSSGYGSADFWGGTDPARERTDGLVSHGRSGAYRKRLARGTKLAIAAGGAVAGVTVLVMLLAGGGASWPASVTTVQREVAQACQNPDVRAEPTQVNFACAKGTRQILWVFALLTSGNDPSFTDPRTGREGLEPITPAQGGEVAWSLNLHHPYDPADPVDSIEVAARALNNIIGGASLTGSHGNPVVQRGLEGVAANCVRYTGSRGLTSRKGFPPLCARPVASPAGEAALVSDVYQKWIVGASPRAAQDAAVLFENAKNPGDPRVQVILRHLRSSRPAG